jgi:D-alanyl-D-alanine carboxypeptidase
VSPLNLCKYRVKLFFVTVALFVSVCLCAPSFSYAAGKNATLVIDADTGVILHEENAGELRYPASLVKMMTLYMAFSALESGRLSMTQRLTVSDHAAGQSPSNLHLRAGQTITVNDAILAVIIKSANDAAVVLAEAIGGTEGRFADMMNSTAKKIGMSRTNFENASGLPNLKQKSTAYDLARLAVALRRDYGKYYHLFDKSQFTFNKKTYYTHNRVTKNYRGADGLKTGYIRASGFNLVTSAKRNGKSLVGVVLGGQTIKGRDRNMMKLLDNAFYKVSRGAKGAVATAAVEVLPGGTSVGAPMPQLKPGTKIQVSNTPTPDFRPENGLEDPENDTSADTYNSETAGVEKDEPAEVEQGGDN